MNLSIIASPITVALLSLLSLVQLQESKYVKREPTTLASSEGLKNASSPCARRSTQIGNVVRIAIYPYEERFADLHCKEQQMIWGLTDSQSIKAVTEAFSIPPIDGSRLGTMPDAYVYFKRADGSIVRLTVLLDWRYIMVDGEITKLYRLGNEGSRIIKQEAKKLPN